MSIIRAFLTAVILTFVVIGVVYSQQDIENYDTLFENEESEGPDEVGIYDSLSAEDYERISKDISVLSATQFSLARFQGGIQNLLGKAPQLLPDLGGSLDEMSPTRSGFYFLILTLKIVLFFLIGYVIETQLYGRRIAGPWFVKLLEDKPQGIAEKLPILTIRAALALVGVVISLLVAGLLLVSILNLSDAATQKTVLVVVPTIAIVRLSAILWRMIVAPYLSQYRLPALSDRDAKKLYNWLWVTVTVSLVSIAFTYWLRDLGANEAPHDLVTLVAAIVIMVINVAMIVANARAISKAFLGDRTWASATWLAKTGSTFWAPVAILYIVLSWAYQSYKLVLGIEIGQPPIIGAYSILLAVMFAYGAVAFIIARLFQHRRKLVQARALARARDRAEDREARVMPHDVVPLAAGGEGDPISDDDGDDEEGGPAGSARVALQGAEIRSQLHGLRDFEDLARRVATIVAIIAGIYAMASIWDLEYLFDEGQVFDRVEDIVDILLVGYIAYQGVRIWIDTKIEEEIGEMPEEVELGGDGGGESSVSRLATLLPLFRNLLLFFIIATVILLVLLEGGINVAPLFAGAGVVGLAIGFGAQALIRDILSGAFFLIDDAFRRGEYIDVGSVKGTVERISIRSFQLRHHLGALHTIPFGEIQHLTNFSRDWVMMKLPLRVTYDTDVEKVRKLIKKLGQELLNHPTEGEKFMQPLKSQGVYRMEDSAMIIRVKFMTRPGDQWTTRKLVYGKIRELFAENGVKFAHREVTVRLGDREEFDLTTEEREAIGAAAQQATVAADERLQPVRAGGMDDR